MAQGLKPVDKNNCAHWIETDPSQDRFDYELRLKEALLGDGSGPYFHTVTAVVPADLHIVAAQREALYMVLAELIEIQRTHRNAETRSASGASGGGRGAERDYSNDHAFTYEHGTDGQHHDNQCIPDSSSSSSGGSRNTDGGGGALLSATQAASHVVTVTVAATGKTYAVKEWCDRGDGAFVQVSTHGGSKMVPTSLRPCFPGGSEGSCATIPCSFGYQFRFFLIPFFFLSLVLEE